MAIKVPEKHKDSEMYLRVGVDYFKLIKKPDRFGIIRNEIKKWNKEEIKLDHGAKILYDIPKFDDFIIEPNNNGLSDSIGNCYNMYYKFPHVPKEGEWKWTKILLEQIFGNQYPQGLIYLKVLYEYPKQALPILVLVSVERSTGKSTFLDWLNMIFGSNMCMIEPDVIGASFNGEYATSNIIAIDETILDKQIAVEKIKSLATKKFISVNIKQVQQFKLPFFGKIIMASNNEDKFMRIDDKEIRFWIRKLGMPKVKNHNILNDMIPEIPAFLHYLKTLPTPDFTKSRMVLTEEEIQNKELEAVKRESKSGLYKELIELFNEHFAGMDENAIEYFTPKDLKDCWFSRDNKISIAYIRRVLKNEFEIDTVSQRRYRPILGSELKPGTPFFVVKNFFTENEFFTEKYKNFTFDNQQDTLEKIPF